MTDIFATNFTKETAFINTLVVKEYNIVQYNESGAPNIFRPLGQTPLRGGEDFLIHVLTITTDDMKDSTDALMEEAEGVCFITLTQLIGTYGFTVFPSREEKEEEE